MVNKICGGHVHSYIGKSKTNSVSVIFQRIEGMRKYRAVELLIGTEVEQRLITVFMSCSTESQHIHTIKLNDCEESVI